MKRIILLCTLLVFISPPAKAQEKILDIQEITSEQGITAWLVEDHSVPVISFSFAFEGAGAVLEPEAKQGLVQLLSNTMDEGAGDLDSQTFQKTLLDHSISLSFSGGRDRFSGFVKTLTSEKETAFNLLELALTKPRFDKEPVERMRQANLSRLRSDLSDPGWITSRITNDKAFEGHPYAQNSGGTLTTLKNLTQDDLRKFSSTELTKDRLLIGVSGDISAEELKAVIDDVFGNLPNTSNSKEISDTSLTNKGKTFFHRMQIPQASVQMILPGIKRSHPDYYPFQVMDQIFGAGGFGSRLTENIREKKGLAYGIYSFLMRLDHAQLYFISSSTKNETLTDLREGVVEEIEKIRSRTVTKKELIEAKDYILGSIPLGLTSTSSIASTLVALQSEELPINYLDAIKDHIENVEAKDVERVANKVLKPDDMLTIIVGNPHAGSGEMTEISYLPNVN